ncbi:iki3 [Hyphodiscus hymeniophilus]|uniref:Elongator complex protein 1 n=1 Tax=Hyphodiscus hymeniophilus TaxID=353542 RepID=A0A9P6VQZ5_9HELO|nr:iki3 [Hyphodiscus hymeniophilus]
MRNLRNIRYVHWSSHSQRRITAVAWENDLTFLCSFGPSEENALIELVRINPASKYYPISARQQTTDCILETCLVLAGGDIVVVREEPLAGEDRIEIVGSVDAGITAAKWSPDEEILAITTKANTMVFMSRSFEGITDVTMTSEDLKASNHVSVGWGKKETQFKGKGAKALRDPTMPEKIDEGILSPNDDSRTSISWRGDGAFLAVSTIEGGSRRLIRIYSREGVLDSVSEPVDGLEGALSWRPAGNLIAGIQRLEDHVDVVFFERNGLRHGQFSLRLTPEQLHLAGQHITLSWNSNSTVLAVVMSDCTQLWTMGNYHWYLKQEIRNCSSMLPSIPLLWHPEKALRVMTTGSDSSNTMDYVFTTARGSATPPQDHGVVAVIDGKTIKVTPLQTANVPPPMALHEFVVNTNVIDVAINWNATLIAVLHQLGISMFEWQGVAASGSGPVLTARFTFEKDQTSAQTCQQISFSENNEVLVLQQSEKGSVVRRYGFDDDTGRMEEKLSPDSPSLTISTLSSFSNGIASKAFVQDVSGDLHNLVFGGQSFAHCKFPTQLPWVEMVPHGDDYVAFGMSSNGQLYANSRVLIKNCTSFLVTPSHLIFTTTSHLLKFVHITTVQDLEVPPDDPEIDERCRSIERGARLVTAMPTSASLVLQMPRGNLETIYPRAMVVAGIRALIEQKNYKKAFSNCRTQRVDMNILYDHAPDQLLSNVALFIDQVKKITYIDLFLSSLREEDVTQTMYKETRVVPDLAKDVPIKNTANEAPIHSLSLAKSSKINLICDAFLSILSTRTSTNLQNIITANVCKSPPALDDGLLVVAQLMNEDESMADKAVEHICFLADVNRLYENALGLYRLDLALLVAQQSQKDPREYLPFMQSLQSMTELRRRFTIDDYLSRNAKALTHLHDLDAFTELQAYIQKHTLYQQALSLYRYKPVQHKTLTALYASYLESKSQFKEAALAYESLANYTKATSCYLSSGPSQWRETLYSALSQTPPLSGSALTDLATSLYDALIESKDYFAAATIQLDYLSSIEGAAKTFCKGYFFADALHLVALKHQPKILESVIDPGLGEALASSTELLAECKGQLLAQVPRIRELRAKALADPLAFYEGERGGDGDIPDDISVAASSKLSTKGSLFTRYTGKGSQGTAGTGVSRATSKNRKREERKRARGKKGSVYEEEYLVASVGRLVERVESVREEVGRLVVGLVRRSMWERARAIQGSLAEVIGLCQACVPEVFGAKEIAQTEQAAEGEVYRPLGGDAVLQESIDAAGKRKEPPHVAAFERLSLLGT